MRNPIPALIFFIVVAIILFSATRKYYRQQNYVATVICIAISVGYVFLLKWLFTF